MNNCDHDFIKIGEEPKPKCRTACVVCVYCGQVRYVSDDGRVEIYREKGEVKNLN